RLNWENLRAKPVHTVHIWCLPLYINSTHVYTAWKINAGTRGCAGYPVLSSTSLGDNTFRTKALSKQCLSDSIVNLVSAGVGKIFSLNPNF
ncbi:uncharacterized protein METZ01_LOCUS350296, partial [marine metagenome]